MKTTDTVRSARWIAVPLLVLLVASCLKPYEQLTLRNRSSRTIEVYVNALYPDSSLRKSFGDVYLHPGDANYIANYVDLEAGAGITVFIFDREYVTRQWHEGAGTPDKYLDEDSLLAKYYLSKAELDSLNWRLFFPQ